MSKEISPAKEAEEIEAVRRLSLILSPYDNRSAFDTKFGVRFMLYKSTYVPKEHWIVKVQRFIHHLLWRTKQKH